MTAPARGRTTPNWEPTEVDRLIDLLDKGYSYDAIAAKLGRSRTGVIVKAKRIGQRVTTTLATLSANEIARLLDLGCAKTVVRWVRDYGLPARNAGTARRPLWRISWDALVEWLEHSEHWMMYDPRRVTDPALRDRLIRLRPAQPYWLTTGEVAARLHTTHLAVNTWIANGELPAVRYGNWWVCAADLRHFTPLADRPRHVGYERSSLPVITPVTAFATVREFAEALGAKPQQVYRYLVQRGEVFYLKPLEKERRR